MNTKPRSKVVFDIQEVVSYVKGLCPSTDEDEVDEFRYDVDCAFEETFSDACDGDIFLMKAGDLDDKKVAALVAREFGDEFWCHYQ